MEFRRMNETVQKYWDELPQEMKIEWIERECTKREMLNLAAKELDIEFEIERGDNMRKRSLSEFIVKAIEKYGQN